MELLLIDYNTAHNIHTIIALCKEKCYYSAHFTLFILLLLELIYLIFDYQTYIPFTVFDIHE